MAAFPSGRQTLCQAAVGQFLQRGVYPTEAERLFHDLEVREGVGLRCLRPVASHPARPFREVVLHEPIPQLLPVGEGQEIRYFHNVIKASLPALPCRGESLASLRKLCSAELRVNELSVNS